MYTFEHLAYYECIRAMGDGFGMKLTGEVIGKIRSGDVDGALWINNDAQARRNREKAIAVRAASLLEGEEQQELQHDGTPMPEKFTIKDVVEQTGIPASSIRYWDRTRLLEVERDQHNGYRLFDADVLKQIVLIQTLRNAGYGIPQIKEVLREVRERDTRQAIQIIHSALEQMNKTLRLQLVGVYHLYKNS